MNFREINKNPRDENCCDMLTYSFCPQFSWKSFITIASAINIGLYIISLLLSGINAKGSFLEIHFGWFMSSFSGDVEKIRTGF